MGTKAIEATDVSIDEAINTVDRCLLCNYTIGAIGKHTESDPPNTEYWYGICGDCQHLEDKDDQVATAISDMFE